MARPKKSSRVVQQAIEKYKTQQLSYKDLLKVLKQYPDEPIGDLVPDFRRQQQRELIEAKQIPKGAILANLDKQAPNGSWDVKAYYKDENFRCVDCGLEFTWTAQSQRLWYESVKGSIYTRINRCGPCYRKHKTDAGR